MVSDARGEGGGGGRPSRRSDDMDLGAFVACVVGAVNWCVRDELEPEGITSVEFAILRALQYSEISTATQLGHLLPLDRSSISRAVTNLVNGGLVGRRRRRSDRRVVTLEMTEEGAELTRNLSERVERRYDELLAGVSPEDIRVFMATGRRIMENRGRAEGAR